MITKLTPSYKIKCDRCGKEELRDDTPENLFTPLSMGYHEVAFCDEVLTIVKGGVCNECFKAFLELAENFFDEVNNDA